MGSTWTVEAEGPNCPLCGHEVEHHDGEACSVEVGYDHLNGFHECGCPAAAPASDVVWSVRYTDPDPANNVAPDGRHLSGRLGPYFGEVQARQQATKLRNKGCIVHGVDSGEVSWRPEW